DTTLTFNSLRPKEGEKTTCRLGRLCERGENANRPSFFRFSTVGSQIQKPFWDISKKFPTGSEARVSKVKEIESSPGYFSAWSSFSACRAGVKSRTSSSGRFLSATLLITASSSASVIWPSLVSVLSSVSYECSAISSGCGSHLSNIWIDSCLLPKIYWCDLSMVLSVRLTNCGFSCKRRSEVNIPATGRPTSGGPANAG